MALSRTLLPLCLAPLLLLATVRAQQSPAPAGPASAAASRAGAADVPSGEELRAFRLRPAGMAAFQRAHTDLIAYLQTNPESPLNGGEGMTDLDHMTAKYSSDPQAAAIFARDGISARDYLKTQLIALAGSFYLGQERAGNKPQRPVFLSQENLDYLRTHPGNPIAPAR